jgi:hypothetical protein
VKRAAALSPVSRAQCLFLMQSWGLRPRLYAFARRAGSQMLLGVSIVLLVFSLYLFKGFCWNLTLYTVSVPQTPFRRKSPTFTKQFRDLWAF